MRRKLWKRTGKTRRIDEAMGGAGVHGCRSMPALGLECKNQLVSPSHSFQTGIIPAIPDWISDQHRLVFVT